MHKRLEAAETELYSPTNSQVVADRIADLVAHHLERLGVDSSGWLKLFRDPQDGRFWELSYPQSEMHGGGPPRLALISVEEAKRRFPGAAA